MRGVRRRQFIECDKFGTTEFLQGINRPKHRSMAMESRVTSHLAAGSTSRCHPKSIHWLPRCQQPPASVASLRCNNRGPQRCMVAYVDREKANGTMHHHAADIHPAPMRSMDIEETHVITKFVAETMLPTKHGKFRLRGYRHSVSIPVSCKIVTMCSRQACSCLIVAHMCAMLQVDGGVSFSEPTAIINGVVEGVEDVSLGVHREAAGGYKLKAS